jgi:hypothetical protein
VTQTARIEALYRIRQTHATLACRVTACPICKRYYAILLAPDTKGSA